MLPADTTREIDCSQNNYNEFLLKFGPQNGAQSFGGSYVHFIIDNNVAFIPMYGDGGPGVVEYKGHFYLNPVISSRKIYMASNIATSLFLYARNSNPYTITA